MAFSELSDYTESSKIFSKSDTSHTKHIKKAHQGEKYAYSSDISIKNGRNKHIERQ